MEEQQDHAPRRVSRDIGDVVSGDGSTFVYMDLGRPPTGYIRDIRRLAVFPMPDPFTSLGANVLVMGILNRSRPPNSNTLLRNISDMVITPATIPSDADFIREVRQRSHEHLILVIKGLASGQEVVASGEADEYADPEMTDWLMDGGEPSVPANSPRAE